MPSNKSPQQILEAALADLHTLKEETDLMISICRKLLGKPGRQSAEAAAFVETNPDKEALRAKARAGRPRRKRRLSAEGRKAISEAAKRRWAAIRSESAPAKKKPGRKPKAESAAA